MILDSTELFQFDHYLMSRSSNSSKSVLTQIIEFTLCVSDQLNRLDTVNMPNLLGMIFNYIISNLTKIYI